MFTWLMNALFGTSHERAIRRLIPKVLAINALEASMKSLADAELRGATAELKTKLGNGARLDDLLLQAFAVCREASRRALDMRHHDVQLIGGMVLHEGAIAEMRAGEGKTLVATLAGYLNALEGKGVHVVTVNDYLARRDAERMGKLYDFLGLSTGVVVSEQTEEEKKKAYRCDITYSQHIELGFDYLRDSRMTSALDHLQRPLSYAIVDEADAILIDDALGPHVIKGQDHIQDEDRAIATASPYRSRIQKRDRPLTTTTLQKLFRTYKKLAGMTGAVGTEAAHLRSTFKLDTVILPTNRPMARVDHTDLIFKTEREKFTAAVNEIIDKHKKGQPILIDTTKVEVSAALSRILQKKGIEHRILNRTNDESEAFGVAQAGRKGAVTIATDMAGHGTDIVLGGDPEMLTKLRFKEQGRSPDAEPDAFRALVEELREQHAKEGAEVRKLGGLYVVGTERRESRRIDDQVRARAGRQGDPGMSRFYLSLEDDLIRTFVGDRVKNLMDRMGMPDGEPIDHPWVHKTFENAQKKIHGRSVELRKSLLAGRDPR
jgi:preprotein translocase subunit SecA